MLQFGASLTEDTSSVNYNRNMFIIQATGIICWHDTPSIDSQDLVPNSQLRAKILGLSRSN